jgi:hypothetical protein
MTKVESMEDAQNRRGGSNSEEDELTPAQSRRKAQNRAAYVLISRLLSHLCYMIHLIHVKNPNHYQLYDTSFMKIVVCFCHLLGVVQRSILSCPINYHIRHLSTILITSRRVNIANSSVDLANALSANARSAMLRILRQSLLPLRRHSSRQQQKMSGSGETCKK